MLFFFSFFFFSDISPFVSVLIIIATTVSYTYLQPFQLMPKSNLCCRSRVSGKRKDLQPELAN